MKRTHGMTRTSEYWIWRNMLQRCRLPTRPDYDRYGGRGIRVCERWWKFENFIADMCHKPTPQHSIDRLDNDKDYEPGNVRWATLLEQANNKRSNHRVNYRGTEMTIAEAVRAAGSLVTRETARCRINNGWAVEAAVDTPPLFRRDENRRKITAQGSM